MLKAVSNNEDHPEEGLIPVQPVSLDIWDKKYRLKSKKGDFVDKDVDDTYLRVAKALSDVEDKEIQEQWSDKICLGFTKWSNTSWKNHFKCWRLRT